MALTVLDHPLAQHLLGTLRNASTTPERFRQVSRVLSTLLILEATREVRTRECQVQTPLTMAAARELAQGLAVVPVLRAGLSMLESALELFPDVAVGYVGLERSHDTAVAHSYYCKLPPLEGRFTLCCDPMLATGGSASQALSLLKAYGASPIAMVSVVASAEGVDRVESDHPEVPIYTAGLDPELNAQKYIVPGLGDFGDRLYGTG